jgi:hypothetical protein
MRSIALTLLALGLSTIQSAYIGKNKFGVDVFTVDLDLPEEERFVETSKFFKEPLIQVLE